MFGWNWCVEFCCWFCGSYGDGLFWLSELWCVFGGGCFGGFGDVVFFFEIVFFE